MDTVEFVYGPKTLHLYHNSAAMFAIQDLEPAQDDDPSVYDRMLANTRAGVSLLCQVAHILAQQGELCRRYLQYTPERVPPAVELEAALTPMQIITLRMAVMDAIDAGYRSEQSEDSGDIDLGLLELEKKTKL